MLLNKYQFTITTIKENIYGHLNRKKIKTVITLLLVINNFIQQNVWAQVHVVL